MPETSQEHSVSGGNRLGRGKALVFGIGLARLEAVVEVAEVAEEAGEQVASSSGVSIACHATTVTTSSGTGGEAQCGECPQVADSGEARVRSQTTMLVPDSR
jgi:hypothetical protein